MDEKQVVIPLVDHSNDVVSLKDIEVPDKFFKRIMMEVTVLDELFGGQDWPGIPLGTSILLTGEPGVGKSTASLQIADLLAQRAKRNTLYNVGEESNFTVKMRADRIGVAGNFGLSSIEDVDVLLDVCRDTGVEVLFNDSLQTLRIIPHCETHRRYDKDCKPCIDEAERRSLSRFPMMKAIVKKLHKFAKDTDTIVVIIGHITKGGEFAGPQEIKHDVDVHAHIQINPDTDQREFKLTKNRFGPAGIPYECSLTGKGLDFSVMAVAASEEKKSGSGKAGERRDAIDKWIREAILAGRKISAYDDAKWAAETGMECSGGLWRARLNKVATALATEGMPIRECKLDGKTHYYLHQEAAKP